MGSGGHSPDPPSPRVSLISPRILLCGDIGLYVVIACFAIGFYIANGTWSSPAMLALKPLPALLLSIRSGFYCVFTAVHSRKWKLPKPRSPYPIEV